MIYLDSAAIIKMIRTESESLVLRDWLMRQANEILVSSALVEVEVPRALRRIDPGYLTLVPTFLTRIGRVEIDAPIRATAASFDEQHLRSLDAIHVATAHSLIAEGEKITAFVTYDKRLLTAASATGLITESPA